jgi:rhodanese-related sulfurtransferase
MRNLLPQETWALLQQQPDALFVDVRMEIEFRYVGYPPGVVNIPWYEFPTMKPNVAEFVAAVSAKSTSLDQTIVLICRSGERTVDACIALEKAGFTNLVNVIEGFEGDRDDNGQRSTESGWRFAGLPWSQS